MILGEDAFIIDNIKAAGFRPTKTLIQGMKDINQAFQKLNSVKEFRDYYKNINRFDNDKGELVKSVAQILLIKRYKTKKLKYQPSQEHFS